MSYETITPITAKELLESDSWRYLDVRTVEEYEAGHVPGAYNVPLLERGPMGMQPNPAFAEIVQRHFPTDAQLVVGCKVGGRSMHACELLSSAGYGSLANMDGGFSGRYDEAGQLVQEGWAGCGFPTAAAGEPERTYATLQQ